MNYGYNFYFKCNEDVLTFPITPSQLTIKVGSNNKVVTLIDEGDINILKSPALTEVEFEARFPMRQYPYARSFSAFETYWEMFKTLKEQKKPFRFIVTRSNPKGYRTWDTNLLVSLEKMELNEDASEGDDVLITFGLKQYKEYGIKILPETNGNNESIPKKSTSTSAKKRSTADKSTESSEYVVKSGDCLWNIAKAAYGDGTKYKDIYNANKEAIEADAKKHGKASSSNGKLIWAGLKLTLPGVDNAGNLKVAKL